MTDNLLQKLEEKLMTLLNEVDVVRKEAQALRQENAALKAEHANYTSKLQGLISFLDTMEINKSNPPIHETLLQSKDSLVIA